jgi:putative (di)nucleoside polyphosphate hydrolase
VSAALKPLRRNVCAVIAEGEPPRVLVFRRVEWPTFPNPWQFPQGGLEPGESPEQGLRRELREEIGTNDVEVLLQAPQPVVYEWPPDVMAGMAVDHPKLARFRGQEQYWFLVRLHSGTDAIRFDHQPAEFDAFAWLTPWQALQRVVEFKRQAYRKGLNLLGLLQGPEPPED